jgi:hypothetical protein
MAMSPSTRKRVGWPVVLTVPLWFVSIATVVGKRGDQGGLIHGQGERLGGIWKDPLKAVIVGGEVRRLPSGCQDVISPEALSARDR